MGYSNKYSGACTSGDLSKYKLKYRHLGDVNLYWYYDDVFVFNILCCQRTDEN